MRNIKDFAKKFLINPLRKIIGIDYLLANWREDNARLAEDLKSALPPVDFNRLYSNVWINDYHYEPVARKSFSSSKIFEIINNSSQNNLENIKKIIAGLESCASVIEEIPICGDDSGPEPHWNNGYIQGIDGAMIYASLKERNPAFYCEIGSGNTTKFAAKAIKDNNLRTKIISVDPNPRAEIDNLCHKLVRLPLERTDLSLFNVLGADDILIIDNSHRAFANSDVTVFFTEILPTLPAGLLYAIHDISLPDEIFMERFYNEQYMLAVYLLGGAAGDSIYFPTAFLANHTPLIDQLAKNIWNKDVAFHEGGGFFWMQKG